MKKSLLLLFLLFCLTLLAQAQKFEVDTIMYNGTSDKHINYVFLSDGYQQHELPKYITDVERAVTGVFSKSPFKENRNFFNVFAIKVPSNESGASHPLNANDENSVTGHPKATVQNYFGSTFDYAGIHRLLVATNTAAITNVLANNFPEYDLVFILVNSSYYGGSGGAYAASSTHELSKEIAIHELGHTFAGLADEYWAGPQYAYEKPNLTQTSSPESVKWKKWLNNTGVGIYPHEEANNWFRPHQRCTMRFLSTATETINFCLVCSESITQRANSLLNVTTTPNTPGNISGNTELCSGTSGNTYSINKVDGTGNYTWSVPTGYSILTGQGSPAITVKAGTTSGVISVVASNSYGTSQASSLQVSITTLPTVVAGSNETSCINAASYALTGFTPAGGSWSGSGVTADGKFDPGLAGSGNHTLTYSISQNGCTASSTKVVSVIASPQVSLTTFNDVCSSSTNIQLQGGLPAGGTYSGPGVSNGIFNASEAGPGTHTITYIYTSGGCTSTTSQNINVNTCTAIDEDKVATGIYVFPNPTNSIIHLEAMLKGSAEAHILVYNITGKLIYERKVRSASGDLKHSFDLGKYNKGIYQLCISTDNGIITRRIVLK